MKQLALLPVLTLLAGCTVGPNYKRPTVNVPTDYRGVIPAQPATVASLGNEKWWDVYQDPVLTQLIHTALQQNYDVRIAATRVLQAQAQLGIVRANQFPSASVGADIFSQQNAKVSNLFPAYQVNAGQLNLSVIWNLDFWGKYRRQTEAARAQMLASEWGQQAVISSLVANVATAYFQLRALDAELEIAKRTLRIPPTIPAIDSGARDPWLSFRPGLEPVRTTRIYRLGKHSRPRAADTTAGKPSQHPARCKPWLNTPRARAHRAARAG